MIQGNVRESKQTTGGTVRQSLHAPSGPNTAHAVSSGEYVPLALSAALGNRTFSRIVHRKTGTEVRMKPG